MLFLTILLHIPGAWIRDASVGAYCSNMECLTPSVPWAEDVQEPQAGGMTTNSLLSIHPQLHSTPHQDHHHHHHHQDVTLCAPKYTFWCWLWASSEGRAGFCCAEHYRHPEKDLRAWAQKEVSSEGGHHVGVSCPGVTQCTPPICWHPSAPLEGFFPWSREQASCPPSSLVSFGMVKWLPFLHAAQIHQKNPYLARLGRPQQKAPGWSKSSQHRQQRHCKPNSINTDRSGI